MARRIEENRNFTEFDTQARGIEANYTRQREGVQANYAQQREGVEADYARQKSEESRTAGIALLVIGLLATAGIAGGVGVLAGLPMLPQYAGFALLGVGAGGGAVASGVTFGIEKSNLRKLTVRQNNELTGVTEGQNNQLSALTGRQNNELAQDIPCQDLAVAMYNALAIANESENPAEAVAAVIRVIFEKIAAFNETEFAEFFTLFNTQANEQGISTYEEPFITAFAQNAAKFTDAQIENMNGELARRIHENKALPVGESRFGIVKIFHDMDRDLDAAGIAAAIERYTAEDFAEFVYFLDKERWGLPPQKFIDALAIRGEQFTEELVVLTSEELCAAIAASASLPQEQKVRFTLWRTLAEMRERMTQEQVLVRIEGYSQPKFDTFADYMCSLVRDNPGDQVPATVKSALTSKRVEAKWIGLFAKTNNPSLVSQLWNSQVPDEPFLNELLCEHDLFYKDLVMVLYGRLSIDDQEKVLGKIKNGEKKRFVIAHLMYLNSLLSEATYSGGVFDEGVLKTDVVRTLLKEKSMLRPNAWTFEKVMRGDDDSGRPIQELTPGFILKLLELSCKVAGCKNGERPKNYPGFETDPAKLIKALTDDQFHSLKTIVEHTAQQSSASGALKTLLAHFQKDSRSTFGQIKGVQYF